MDSHKAAALGITLTVALALGIFGWWNMNKPRQSWEKLTESEFSTALGCFGAAGILAIGGILYAVSRPKP